jgi:hypothetical protein
MAKMKKGGSDTPMPEQTFYPNSQENLQKTNAIPRSTEYDLQKTTSRTRIGSWGDEQTFTVEKKGNLP